MTNASAMDLEDLIKKERAELMQVFSILRCLYGVLLHADGDDSTSHAVTANVCAQLTSESANRLEVLLKRYKSGELRVAPRMPPTSVHRKRHGRRAQVVRHRTR